VLYYKNEYFALPAFPIKDVVDPTGAGDTFAGGFMGYLAQNNCTLDWKALKNAAVHGSLLASYTVQDFSVKSLKTVTHEKIQGRLQDFRRVVDLQS
jgi:sugar/nucleoside kinase (ribokinase family)